MVSVSNGLAGALASDKFLEQLVLPGPCSLMDDELGLCPLPAVCVGASALGPKVDYELDQVLEDTVIKVDHQKADDAAVPDHLLLQAFAMGYGEADYPACHLEALDLAPTSQLGFLDESKPPMGWRGAFPGLCLFALRHWQSRVT